jgi:hypothetical protein
MGGFNHRDYKEHKRGKRAVGREDGLIFSMGLVLRGGSQASYSRGERNGLFIWGGGF